MCIKGLSGNLRMEVGGLANYVSRENKTYSNIDWREGDNNINKACQHVILKN